MPIELGVWRLGEEASSLPHQGMDDERRLEQLLEKDIGIIAPHLMVIGRQVSTTFGKFVDLIGIDVAGNLAIVELKRNQTPRDVIAQALDYGSWLHQLESEAIAAIWQQYLERYRPSERNTPLDQAFCKYFHVRSMPDELNSEHELIIAASVLDESTERIVEYLANYHAVNINVALFRLFKDGDREYLTRAWIRDPNAITNAPTSDSSNNSWNGEYYCSFAGENRDWAEATKYGFISGGGGPWYSNSLSMLSPGDRIWVNIPGTGYVGVGTVEDSRVPIDEFTVPNGDGSYVPITSLPLKIAQTTTASQNPEKAEFLVRVKWLKAVPIGSAFKELGFFGNQNTVARPRTQKWAHTVERLKQRFNVA